MYVCTYVCTTELPQSPWQDISIDFMGLLPSGEYVFAATDCYSRYVEVTIAKRIRLELRLKVWKTRLQTYWIAYPNTPHPTTGMCSAELMFRRKLRTKLPELREEVRLDEETQDKDRDKKKQCFHF